MKRIISLILCVITAASVSLSAFAKSGTIVPGIAQTVTIGKGSSAEYSFTAPETAVYQVTVKALTNTYAELYLSYDNDEYGGVLAMDISYNNDNNEESVFNDFFTTYKGYKYTLSLSNMADTLDKKEQKELGVPDTAKFELSVKKTTLPEVALGGTYTSNNTFSKLFMDDDYFCMIPKVSGYYNFRSQPQKYVAPTINIISDDCIADYGGGLTSDFASAFKAVQGAIPGFDFTYYMEKGHCYLICISGLALNFIDEEDAFDVRVTFSVNDGNNIKAESIKIYEDKISMPKGDTSFNTCTVYPAGVTPFDPDEITVTSSNPKVADVSCWDAEHNRIDLQVDSYRFGRTTITVTLPDGLSTNFKVAVKPRIIIFIEELFSALFG